MGEAMRNKIKRWGDKGNPNVQSYKLILDAESAAYKFCCQIRGCESAAPSLFSSSKKKKKHTSDDMSDMSQDEDKKPANSNLMFILMKNKLKRLLDVAMKKYHFAIICCAQHGNHMDAAFASERLGEFCWKVLEDHNEAKYRIEESIKYWKRWGALGKVHHVETKFSSLLNPDGDLPHDIFLDTANEQQDWDLTSNNEEED